jgi:hypothetical protein
MWLSLERELDLHVEEELLVPKDESQDVDQPHEEVFGVVEATHVESSIINGRNRITLSIFPLYWIDILKVPIRDEIFHFLSNGVAHTTSSPLF